MSLSLNVVQQTEFDAMVKAEYRSRGFILRDACRVRTEVIGNTVQFRKVGEVVANQVAYQNTIAIQDPGYTAHTATLLKYAAGTAVDEIQDLTVNFESKQELAMVVAMAVGRRSDQIFIDAVDGSAGSTIVDGGTNMSYAKLRNIVQLFEERAVPLEERYIAMSGNNLRALLAADQLISRFYTSNDAVSTGTLHYRDVLGMNVRIIPTMTEGGLPLGDVAANIRECFAWQKMAVGMGIGQDLRTEVNYLPRETSWFVNGLFFAGAVVIDNRGVFQINCDESVNP
jgi:hypothetical protein